MKLKKLFLILFLLSILLLFINYILLNSYKLYQDIYNDSLYKLLFSSNLNNEEDIIYFISYYNAKYKDLYQKYNHKYNIHSSNIEICTNPINDSNIEQSLNMTTISNKLSNSNNLPSIFFLKTHKTCSTTTTSLFWRFFCNNYEISNNKLVFDWNCFLPTSEHAGRTFNFELSRDIQFILSKNSSSNHKLPLDIWLNHAWIPNLFQYYKNFLNYKEKKLNIIENLNNQNTISKIMKPPQMFVSIIRQPSTRLRSAWSWYNLSNYFDFNYEKLDSFLSQTLLRNTSSISSSILFQKYNWFTFYLMNNEYNNNEIDINNNINRSYFFNNFYLLDEKLKSNKNFESMTQELLGINKYSSFISWTNIKYYYNNYNKKLFYYNKLIYYINNNFIIKNIKSLLYFNKFKYFYNSYKTLLINIINNKIFLLICERYEESILLFFYYYNSNIFLNNNLFSDNNQYDYLYKLIYSNQKTNSKYKNLTKSNSYNYTTLDYLQPFDLLLFKISNLILTFNLIEIIEEKKEINICNIINKYKILNNIINKQCNNQEFSNNNLYCNEIKKSNRDNIVDFHQLRDKY